MAALTNDLIIDEVAAILGIGGGSSDDVRTSLQRAANHAGRILWGRHLWPERIDDAYVNTVAIYSTGTATFTNASTALTGTGTTWTGFTARKVARSLGSPWYRTPTVGGATSITLDRAYLEATAADATYVIFNDEYDLAADVDQVLDVSLVNSQTRGDVRLVPVRELDRVAFIPGASGPPREYGITVETTALTRRIRVYPVPDIVYAIRYRYAKSWSDLSGANAHPFDQDRERLWIRSTVLLAQSLAGRMIESEDGVARAIEENWSSTQAAHPLVIRRRPFDHHRSAAYNRDLSGLTS